jgi:hypothetical protein
MTYGTFVGNTGVAVLDGETDIETAVRGLFEFEARVLKLV